LGPSKSEETGIALFNLERKLGGTSEQGLETAPLLSFSTPPGLIETSIYQKGRNFKHGELIRVNMVSIMAHERDPEFRKGKNE
jgi:hypothetical protein